MEIIRGKQASFIAIQDWRADVMAYERVHLDIGTGDGRYIQQVALAYPRQLAIGLDACRENLRAISRRAPANARYLIANALDLPPELNGLADSISIYFPWGSLLDGLLNQEAGLIDGLARVAQSGAELRVYLNNGALSEAGFSLEAGADRAQTLLAMGGFPLSSAYLLGAVELRALPTTWAKRLAYGRDPRAVYLRGHKN